MRVNEAATTSATPPRSAPPTDWIAFARVGAIAAVVLVHAFSPLVSTIYADLGTPTWWVANTVDAALRWCVPVFVMISGGLLLTPREEGVGEFYRRRWAKIGVPLLVWSVAYLIWQQWRDDIGASGAATQIATGSPSIHLYFLYAIAVLYLLTPFLRTLVAHTPREGLWWLAGLMLALGAAEQSLALVEDAGGVTAVTQFFPFLGYYLLGWLLMSTAPGPRTTRYGALAFAAGATLTALGAGAAAHSAGEWGTGAEYWYDFLSPAVFLSSVGALVLLRAAGQRLSESGSASGRAKRVVEAVSGLSFGVYLVHVMVLYTLRDVGWTPSGAAALLTACWYAVATAVISLLLVAAMRRVPLLRSTV